MRSNACFFYKQCLVFSYNSIVYTNLGGISASSRVSGCKNFPIVLWVKQGGRPGVKLSSVNTVDETLSKTYLYKQNKVRCYNTQDLPKYLLPIPFYCRIKWPNRR